MELIKISTTKLKIMLSADDMKKYEFDISRDGDISSRTGFRHILMEAKDKCGFDALGERVYVQYYPEKHGGCEMFVTKLDCRRGDEVALRGEHAGSTVLEYASVSELICACAQLMRCGYSGSSEAYYMEGRVFLELGCSTYLAEELCRRRHPGKYKFVLREHGRSFCKNAVGILGKLW